MRRKAEQHVEKALQVVERVTTQKTEAASEKTRLTDTAQLLGAVRAMQSLGRNVSAQSFHALMMFRDNKGHEAFGFDRFDDFLDEHPDSPMSKHQFYERVKALQREGDSTFDLLNSLKVPISTRKLLASGTVKVEADEIVVGDERARLDDPSRITAIIKSLANESAEQKRTIERGKADNLKLKKRVDQAKKSGSGLPSSYDQALLNLLGAFTLLLSEAEQLPAHELAEKKPYTLEQIANQRRRLEAGFGLKPPPLTDAERAAGLDAVIDELDDEM